MSDKPDFDALRAKRNESVGEVLKAMCERMGLDPSRAVSTFNPNDCYCNCPEGPCEHDWSGPDYVSEDECTVSATCARCGTPCIYHDMRVMP